MMNHVSVTGLDTDFLANPRNHDPICLYTFKSPFTYWLKLSRWKQVDEKYEQLNVPSWLKLVSLSLSLSPSFFFFFLSSIRFNVFLYIYMVTLNGAKLGNSTQSSAIRRERESQCFASFNTHPSIFSVENKTT